MLKGAADESVAEKPTAELVAQYHEDVEKSQNVMDLSHVSSFLRWQ